MTTRARRWTFALSAALLLMLVLAFTALPTAVARTLNRTLDGASGSVSDQALRLHGTLSVADLHSDALLWNRSLLRRGTWGHVDVPRLIEGRVAVQAFTVVTKTPKGMNITANTGDTDNITLLAVLQRWPMRTWFSLAERALHQARRLQRASEESDGRLVLLRTRDDLRRHLARRGTPWASGDGTSPPDGGPSPERLSPGAPPQAQPVAGFLGLEGAHALEGDLANVDRLFQAGFRMFGLTHFFDNEVGGSAHGVGGNGLSILGVQLLERMEALGIVVDLAHASPALIDDVLARATRPVVVSHTGVKGTCDNQRNLDDDRLAAIASTGGVVGIGLWETALCGATPRHWAMAVRHATDVAGLDHVALGSDWDGAVPAIIDASQTAHLTQALLDEGFSEPEIRKIMGENTIRVLMETLPGGVLPR